MAVSHFPRTAWLQQDWNRYSADVVEKSLAQFAPTVSTSFRSAPTNLSSADTIVSFAESIGHRGHASGARLLVFYYVGHAVTSTSGQVYLLQSGVTPESLRGLTAGQAPPRLANLGELLRVVEAATPVEPYVALRLSDLHAALSKSNVPFVILLDGCMENAAVKQSVEGAGFRYDPQHPTLYYIGSEPLTQRLISQVGTSLREFGQAWAYLHDANPIVFAAKPGTLAMLGEDPRWQMAPPLAPIAQRVRRLLVPSATGSPGSLAELVTRTVDFRQGVGELELGGSISWSDFSGIERTAHTIVAMDRRMPFVDATSAVVARHDPRIGVIEGFYFSEPEKRFYLVSQGNDWKVWRWSGSADKKLIAADLRFPVVAGTADGQIYLHHDEGKTLATVDPAGHLYTVKTDLYIERMAPGRQASDLLVIGEASSVGEAAPLWLVKAGSLVEIDRLPSSGIISIAAGAPSGIAYSRDNETTIYTRVDGRENNLATNLEAPGQLTRAGGLLYCLSQNKTRLYRLSSDGLKQAELLLKDGSPLLQQSDRPDGLQGTSAGTLLVTSGSTIIELRPEGLLWAPVPYRMTSRT